jgi:hypothetical protein
MDMTSLFKCLVLRPEQQFDGAREEQPTATCWLRGEGGACRRAMDHQTGIVAGVIFPGR